MGIDFLSKEGWTPACAKSPNGEHEESLVAEGYIMCSHCGARKA